MPRLENWEIINYSNNEKALYGKVYDDEKGRFPDGSGIRTSLIQELDLENNIAKTMNTTYALGKKAE